MQVIDRHKVALRDAHIYIFIGTLSEGTRHNRKVSKRTKDIRRMYEKKDMLSEMAITPGGT